VPISSIDGFIEERGLTRPISLIKIDVQGYELAVCHGMAATIERQAHVAVAVEYMPEALEELGFNPPALLDWFRDRKFGMYSLGKDGELTSGLSAELAAKGYVDLIFSRSKLA
jgi:hypothetical protein